MQTICIHFRIVQLLNYLCRSSPPDSDRNRLVVEVRQGLYMEFSIFSAFIYFRAFLMSHYLILKIGYLWKKGYNQKFYIQSSKSSCGQMMYFPSNLEQLDFLYLLHSRDNLSNLMFNSSCWNYRRKVENFQNHDYHSHSKINFVVFKSIIDYLT